LASIWLCDALAAAGASLLTAHAFDRRMNCMDGSRRLAAALDCWLAGALSIAAAVGIGAMSAATAVEQWSPRAPQAGAALVIVLSLLLRVGHGWHDARLDAVVILGVVLAAALPNVGGEGMRLVMACAALIWLAWRGRDLVGLSDALLRNSRRW
jgi:hypothetical protein